MYTTEIDEQQYAIKPMNCPAASPVQQQQHLPRPAAAHGRWVRAPPRTFRRPARPDPRRAFTEDDAHIYMTDQISDEVLSVIRRSKKFTRVRLRIRHRTVDPPQLHGYDEEWEPRPTVCAPPRTPGMDYTINEGDGAFYGPKIDFHLRDAIGRSHQCGTIQLDMQLPQRFDATYVGPDGEKHRVVMIHRAIYGSMERFIAILIEHYAGRFPFWLAPVQAKIIPISDKQNDYAPMYDSCARRVSAWNDSHESSADPVLKGNRSCTCTVGGRKAGTTRSGSLSG